MPSDVRADAAPRDPTTDARGRWQLPLWALQVLEFGVAFLLVTQSVHVVRGGLLVGAGAALFVLAVTADGPLGIVRLCSPRLHRVLVMALAVVMGACCALAALRPDAEGLLVVGAAVVALLVLAARTDVSGGSRRRTSSRRGEVIDVTATVTPPADAVAEPEPDDPTRPSTLRKAGRATGAAAAVGKQTVDEHRPQVEDQVKRSIRGAGRLAGKLAGTRQPPDGDGD